MRTNGAGPGREKSPSLRATVSVAEPLAEPAVEFPGKSPVESPVELPEVPPRKPKIRKSPKRQGKSASATFSIFSVDDTMNLQYPDWDWIKSARVAGGRE